LDRKIGFIGLGNIGTPMALNIAKAGFDLTVYDIRAKPLKQLEKAGAKVAGSSREVAERCDIIQIIVVNDAQLESVVFGDGNGGVLGGGRLGSIIAIHSTVKPSTCRNIAAMAKEKGIGVLDAPVSGGAVGARAGTLSVMVGGSPADMEVCRPVFSAFAKSIVHIGEVGTGQVAKLTNNLVSYVNLEGLKEGLRLARLAGIDERKMLDALKASSGNSWRVENWVAHRKALQHYTTGQEGLAQVRYKDISLALAEAHQVGASLPVAALVSQLVTKLTYD